MSRSFQGAYRHLEVKMQRLAQADGDIYLPNPEPKKPVHHVLIAMEPSLGRWAQSPDEARAKVQAGFRNFLYSYEDFLVHHSVRTYLCQPGERYHVTDISKGAMLVGKAGIDRKERYRRWIGLLLEELALVSIPGATLVAVGKAVSDILSEYIGSGSFIQVIHYSGQAAKARNDGIVGREASFEAFAAEVSSADIVGTATQVLQQSEVPARFQEEALSRIRKRELTLSRKKLIFNYRLVFESQQKQ
ncbi:MAG: hypothetical protein AAF752_16035 [Bacteroidota bacterium]